MSLVGVAEIAELVGVSKQVIANWRSRKADFPPPVAELKSGPVWSRDAILEWARSEDLEIQGVEDDDVKPAPTRRAVVSAMMNMKGGVGKSTLAANLGWYAAYSKDKRVLLVDLDPQFNLSQYIFGAQGYEQLLAEEAPTVEAIFQGTANADQVINKFKNWRGGSCLHIVPANLELAWQMKYVVDKPHMLHEFIEEVRSDYDLILIDCSPTESILSTAAYMSADYIFVPVRPEFLSTIGLPLLLRSMKEFGRSHKSRPVPEIGGIIFNDTGEKVEHDRSREYVEEFAANNGLTVFENDVSHSDSYPAGARVGKPIFMTDNARSWKVSEFARVANEFLDKVGLR